MSDALRLLAIPGPYGAASVGVTADGTGAVTQNVDDVLKERISVKRYGAKGDGTTDDSAAIMLANAVAIATGKDLFFPAGTYRILSFLELSTNTSWVGEDGSRIYLDPNMTLGASFGGYARAIYARNKSNISFNNLEFYSVKAGATRSITIAFENVDGLKVVDCNIHDFGNATYYAQGLIGFNCDNVTISRTTFADHSGDGAAFSDHCSNVSVTNSYFYRNGDWHLAFSIGCDKIAVIGNMFMDSTSTATGIDRCNNAVFANNIIINAEHGIRICRFAVTAEVNQRITITGNTIINAGVIGISVEEARGNGQVTITGNTLEGSSGQGISVTNSENFTITGNAIYSTINEAILVWALTSGVITGRGVIAANKVTTCTYGVRQLVTSGTASKITVVGNDLTQCSAARVSVVGSTTADVIDGSDSNLFMSVSHPLNIPSGFAETTATAGAATLPANPVQFFPFYVGGVKRKIALYGD